MMKYAYYGHPIWYYTHLTVDTEYHSKYMVIINTVYGDVRTIFTVLFMIKYWYYSHPIWYYTHLTVDTGYHSKYMVIIPCRGGGYTTDVIRPLHTVLFMMKYAYYGHPTYRVL